jgi:hypothetical protein
MDSTALTLLLAIVLPMWLVAGFGDYLCHRATRIEATSGWRESALHAVQMGEVGSVILAALALEVTGGLVVFCVLIIAAHEATAWLDLSYAGRRRRIAPVEQMLHSFLEVLPIAALLLLLAFRWPTVEALREALADLTFRPSPFALPSWYVAMLAISALALGIGPYAEELWRCLRAERAGAEVVPATPSP